MTFLTNLGVTEIFCIFRLVLEGKKSKKIPESSRLDFLEKKKQTIFALSSVEGYTFRPLNRRGINRFTCVESVFSNSPKVLRTKFLGI